MNLKCKINGIEYPIVQGVTFTEEYNETLDSGSIIIDHVSKIKNLAPYDDVFIFDGEFNGFDQNGVVQGSNRFFKHLLIDNFTEELINIDDRIYKYKISLMSEIKALEKIPLPNISITQPIVAEKKISVWEYLNRFIKLYSPKIKVVNFESIQTWKYLPKYKLDPNLENIFGNVYSPDFSLTSPTLRDLLSKLMIVKDMIPYVENNIIKAMDITLRKNNFGIEDIPLNSIIGTMNSGEYCHSLKRQYSDALSEDSTCRSVEYLGFRNSDSALITLENMRLETRFPIYKINKIYMCYYKISNIEYANEADELDPLNGKYYFLCKQDITKLVKLNQERNSLSQDWDEFNEDIPSTIDELAQYKLCTVGYSIGSNVIEGWGQSYTYPKGWWQGEGKTTYIENILRILDKLYPMGVWEYDTLLENISPEEKKYLRTYESPDIFNTIITPFSNYSGIKINTKSALDMKGLFFIIDYQAFYSGNIIASKDNGLDNIISIDNSSSSLALLEQDGLSLKEKVNRLGNKTFQFRVRYDNYQDLSQLRQLGDVFNNEDDTDIVIYHREYSIYDNYISCIYYGAKDYVLKNYYTSVYARHRTWNLIPYGESVTRSENQKFFLYFSKGNSYYEDLTYTFLQGIKNNPYDLLLSSLIPDDEVKSLDSYDQKYKINFGWVSHISGNYLADINAFSSGYSLAFNIKMVDNQSMGTYISKISPFANKKYDGTVWQELDRDYFDTHKDYTGSNQSLWQVIDDVETGQIAELYFFMGHNESEKDYNESLTSCALNSNYKEDIYNIYYQKLLLLPKINYTPNITVKIGYDKYEAPFIDNERQVKYIYKDNKEIIDMTYQIEPITNDKDILFSSWLMRLNKLLANYNKVDTTYTYKYNYQENFYNYSNVCPVLFYCGTYVSSGLTPDIVIKIKKQDLKRLYETQEKNKSVLLSLEDINYINTEYNYEEINKYWDIIYTLRWTNINFLRIENPNIEENNTEKFILTATQVIDIKYKGDSIIYTRTSQEQIVLDRISYDIDRIRDEMDLENYAYYDNRKYYRNISYNGTYFDRNSTDYRLNNGFTYGNLQNYSNDDGGARRLYEYFYWDTHLSKTYEKNMFIVYSTEPLKNTLVYNEYYENTFPSIFELKKDLLVSNIFQLKKDDNKGNYIRINVTELPSNVKSIQYWYKLINENEEESKHLFKFVFGVNINEEDIITDDDGNKFVDIYVSLLYNRDTRVYDLNNNIIGNVYNYKNNDKQYGEEQYYEGKD